MKKLLATVLLAQIALPAIAFAAYNDVSLVASNAVLSVGGITVNVSGNGATIQSIVVNSSSFDVTLLPGSQITVSAPGLNKFSYTDIGTGSGTNQCNSTVSTLTITGPATASITTTITPSSTICTNGSSGGGGAPAGLISGTGGYTAPTPGVAILQTTASTVVNQNTNVAGGGSHSGVSASSAGGTIVSFSRTLRVGSKGSDVRDLQVYLNTHGFVIAKRGPGAPGRETKRFGEATKTAVKKLQRAAGIRPVNGLLGPLTRAYIASHP